jgi:hypothetical protein
MSSIMIDNFFILYTFSKKSLIIGNSQKMENKHKLEGKERGKFT